MLALTNIIIITINIMNVIRKDKVQKASGGKDDKYLFGTLGNKNI